MKVRNILSIALLAAGCLTASAQTAGDQMVDAFNPHWYVQGQVGGQYTLGERSFQDLVSPNVQVAGGYLFTPVWGLRLSANTWQSKGGSKFHDGNRFGWKYNYIAPSLEATCNLTNLIGWKPRLCNVGLFAGLGLNVAWNNDEAVDARSMVLAAYPGVDPSRCMNNYWDGTKCFMVGRMGAFLDFRVCKRLDVGLEVNCNVLSDAYNSKPADNADWYFNALVGVKYHIGKTTKKVRRDDPCAGKFVEKIVEKPVEKIVEKVVYKEAPATAAKSETLRRDIFFVIRGSEVSKAEMPKVEEVAAYLNKYPEAKVSITGYADKKTGNPTINVGYARKRAQIVADLLVKKFGIAKDRINVDSKGDTVQPYEQNDLNRVSICIAE